MTCHLPRGPSSLQSRPGDQASDLWASGTRLSPKAPPAGLVPRTFGHSWQALRPVAAACLCTGQWCTACVPLSSSALGPWAPAGQGGGQGPWESSPSGLSTGGQSGPAWVVASGGPRSDSTTCGGLWESQGHCCWFPGCGLAPAVDVSFSYLDFRLLARCLESNMASSSPSRGAEDLVSCGLLHWNGRSLAAHSQLQPGDGICSCHSLRTCQAGGLTLQ